MAQMLWGVMFFLSFLNYIWKYTFWNEVFSQRPLCRYISQFKWRHILIMYSVTTSKLRVSIDKMNQWAPSTKNDSMSSGTYSVILKGYVQGNSLVYIEYVFIVNYDFIAIAQETRKTGISRRDRDSGNRNWCSNSVHHHSHALTSAMAFQSQTRKTVDEITHPYHNFSGGKIKLHWGMGLSYIRHEMMDVAIYPCRNCDVISKQTKWGTVSTCENCLFNRHLWAHHVV